MKHAAAAILFSLLHVLSSVGVGLTVLIVATQSERPIWEGWGLLFRTLGHAFQKYPDSLYVLSGLVAVFLVPIRAGIADALATAGHKTRPARRIVAIVVTAILSPLIYLALSSWLNQYLQPHYPARLFTDVETAVLGLWALSTIPITLFTSHLIQARFARHR